jgi:hypothetical protein
MRAFRKKHRLVKVHTRKKELPAAAIIPVTGTTVIHISL